MARKDNLTFFSQYKALTLIACIGTFPPGIQNFIKSPTFLWILRIYNGTVVLIVFIFCFTLSIAICITSVRATAIIMMIRRLSSVVFTFLLTLYLNIPKNQKTLTKVMDTFQTIMPESSERKWKLFRENTKTVWRVYFIGLGIGVFFVSASMIPFYLNRRAPGSSMIFVIHDPEAWYHFILLTWQTITFSCANFGSYTLQLYSQILLVMGITQMRLLQKDLHSIMSKITVDESGYLLTKNDYSNCLPSAFIFASILLPIHFIFGFGTEGHSVFIALYIPDPSPLTPTRYRNLTDYERKKILVQLRKELVHWIKKHQLVLCWIEDLKEIVEYVSTLKLGFVALYLGTTVFTLPYILEERKYTDLVSTLSYCTGILPITFWQSRLAGEIYDISQRLWESVSDTAWYVYPKDIAQTISIIGSRCQVRPVVIRAFYLFKDNSITYQSIIQTAYQALSFLLRMDL